MKVKVWNTKENVDVFLFRKNTFLVSVGYFFVGFSPIPIRVPSSLCNFLKIKSSKREPFLSVKTWNFYCYFSKRIVMVLLFQSRGVSCAFISLRFFYIIPPVGLAAESGSWKYQRTFSKSKSASEMRALSLTTRVSKRQPIYPTLSEYLQSASWGAHIHRTLRVRWEGRRSHSVTFYDLWLTLTVAPRFPVQAPRMPRPHNRLQLTAQRDHQAASPTRQLPRVPCPLTAQALRGT